MLGKLRISTKLMVVISVFVVGVIAVAILGLAELKHNLIEDRKAKVHDVVLEAVQALEISQKQSAAAGLSDKDAAERGKEIIRGLRFGNNDYFFAIDSNGVTTAHPNPQSEGRSMLDAKDSDGVYFSRELMSAAQSGGGFVSYRYPRASGGEPISKVSYGAIFKPWSWTVGGGIYIDDIDSIFWSQVRQIGVLIALVLAAVLATSFVLGRSITKPLGLITDAMRRLAGGDKSIEVAHAEDRNEIGDLARARHIQGQRHRDGAPPGRARA